MPISFAQIPANIKVPLYWVEVDPSMAGLPSINLRALLIGIMTKDGTAIPEIPVPVGSQSMADQYFGAGSELSRMFRAFYANNFANEVWGCGAPEPYTPGPAHTITAATWVGNSATFTTSAAHNITVGQEVVIADVDPPNYNGTFQAATGTTGSTIVVPMAVNPGTYVSGGTATAEITSGTAATGTITITQAPTGAGTFRLYIAGTLVSDAGINILTTDTVTDIAANIADSINADDRLPTTAVAAAGVVTLTAVWKGISGNEITVQTNYYGSIGSESNPVGIGYTLPATGLLTGGAGTPSWTNIITAMGDTPFEYVALGYTDSNTIFEFDQEFGFTDQGRWGWERQLFGHVFYAKRGDYSSLVVWGLLNNSGVSSAMAYEPTSPSPSFEWAAAYCAKAQRALINDPARPLQALTLNQIKMAPHHDQFNFVELNSLASSGLAIMKAGSDTQPMILREQTMYQLNLWGASDDAYELVTTLATLAKLMRNQKHEITTKFPRHKLADDGTKFGPGQAIVTPGIIKAELVSQYQIDMYNGLVENLPAFKQNLIVERDSNDPNRANVLYPPDLINQLRIFAVLNQFRLQYDRGVDTAIIGANPTPFQASSQSLG